MIIDSALSNKFNNDNSRVFSKTLRLTRVCRHQRPQNIDFPNSNLCDKMYTDFKKNLQHISMHYMVGNTICICKFGNVFKYMKIYSCNIYVCIVFLCICECVCIYISYIHSKLKYIQRYITIALIKHAYIIRYL